MTPNLYAGLVPEVERMARQHVLLCAQNGILVALTQGLRTFGAQQAIWEQGRSAPGAIVTNARPGWSWHNWGLAYDLKIADFPGDTTPDDVYDGPWARVGELGEQAGMLWGGRWKHPDIPHFEYHAGQTLAALLALHPQGLA